VVVVVVAVVAVVVVVVVVEVEISTVALTHELSFLRLPSRWRKWDLCR